MASPERIDILGVGVSALNLSSATDAVVDFVSGSDNDPPSGYVCVTGVHGIIEAQDDPELRDILNRSFLTTPDGMPTVWVGRFCRGMESMSRVYGPDLMWEVFRKTEHTPVRHFLYGGNEGVADRLKERLLDHFPGSNIVGTYCPPFRPLEPGEEDDLRRRLEDTRPHLTWIGLSTPKQERFMAHYLDRLPAGLMLGVGAAFDFHAGLVSNAPAWVQQNGLEWFYRLTREPARLWPRYRKIVPRFLYLMTRQLTGGNPPANPSGSSGR